MMKKTVFLVVCGMMLQCWAGISGLQGEYRNGQVFLQWQEKDLPADARLSVWSSREPISVATLGKAEKVAAMLNTRSANDWWLNPQMFHTKRSKKARSEEIFAGKVADTDTAKLKEQGFVITDRGEPLAPDGGLHVHTPKSGQTGSRYFAVTLHKGTGSEVLGITATTSPVSVGKGKANAIALKGAVTSAVTAGKPLVVYLHGRGGGSGVDSKGNAVGTHLLFTDSDIAWREGIPVKFTVRAAKNGTVELVLNDRIWAGRKLTAKESSDRRDHVHAIATFWLGYNPNIGVGNFGPEFKWNNYTERLVIHIVRWVQENYKVDKNRTYLRGGSMGGSGSVHIALHYPEMFAAVLAYVPVYSYTWEKTAGYPKLPPSIGRIQCSVGLFKPTDKVLSPDGKDLLEYGNGAKNINRPAVDMPPIFASNGRKDMSIPWVNNPPFYRAANEAKQAFAVNWCNGPHSLREGRDIPKVLPLKQMLMYRLDQCFPAFSNCSDNKNYGNGDPADGDLTGWINRGMQWKNVTDTPERLEIELFAEHEDMLYPVKCDVTLRRRQHFRFAPGTRIYVTVNGEKRETSIDKNGLLTVENVVFKNADPVKVVCTLK